MATRTFTVTLTDEAAALVATPPAGEDNSDYNRQVLADRTRTIDQIKRLYAVVMGFALTTCFGNMYQCARVAGILSYPSYVIILAQGISFVSLISLFYLGAERLFDNRYAQRDSRVPTRWGLLTDLFTTGITAAWFVVLADTFPDASKVQPTPEAVNDFQDAIRGNIFVFSLNLLILYVADIVFVLIQTWRIRRHPVPGFEIYSKHHLIWLCINVVMAILMLPILHRFVSNDILNIGYDYVPAFVKHYYEDAVYFAFGLIIIHVVRFIIDYTLTFESYYPPRTLKP
jgi:hypothetical protein